MYSSSESLGRVLCCIPAKANPVSVCFWVGMASFLLYSVHEGIRGIPLDPADKSDALVPVSGTSLAVGIDFHAGKCEHPIYSSLLKLFLDQCSSRIKTEVNLHCADNRMWS